MNPISLIASTHNWLAGKTGLEHLPQRVRTTIRAQQDASEILIGWLQFGVLVVFASLYTVSPKTFADESAFTPVPWALGAYFVFTLIRLYLAHRHRTPYWFLAVSVVVDMALLLGLIWSFHLQYQQPPSFYLKAPTLLYVFIFIALRALRFEPGFVVLSGLVASAGWLILVWYAMAFSGDTQMVTRDYVEYMTSNSVLIGAEFDKVVSILVVTAILTTAIARARARLIGAVVEQSHAKDLSRFVPKEVIQQVTTAEEPDALADTELREATILYLDIASFTSIGENLPPRELIVVLNEFFTAVEAPIERYNGMICQFQGDAVLASFNLPQLDQDHAANAVRAALDIQSLIQDQVFGKDTKLGVRIGINTGEVVGGLVGTPKRVGYTVHGDAVNLAARLEQLNKQFETTIIVSGATRRATGEQTFEYRHLGIEPIRGRVKPLDLFEVGSPGSGKTPDDSVPS